MSLKINSATELLTHISNFNQKVQEKNRKTPENRSTVDDSDFRLAVIDPNYTDGRPSLVFNGEIVPTVKKYPYLSSYSPVPNDVVLLVKISNSYVILGKII